MTAQLALVLRDAGIRTSTAHAEAIESGWSERAYTELCVYAFGHAPFTSEDYRDHLAAIGFPVPVPKALGGIFQRAARQRVIQRVGYAKSRERHCSPVPLWEAA